MKRITLSLAVIAALSVLTSCSMEYQINHPHVQHQKGKSDRWTHSRITMLDKVQSVVPQTASATVPASEKAASE